MFFFVFWVVKSKNIHFVLGFFVFLGFGPLTKNLTMTDLAPWTAFVSGGPKPKKNPKPSTKCMFFDFTTPKKTTTKKHYKMYVFAKILAFHWKYV